MCIIGVMPWPLSPAEFEAAIDVMCDGWPPERHVDPLARAGLHALLDAGWAIVPPGVAVVAVGP